MGETPASWRIGMLCEMQEDGTYKSSVDKFYDQDDLQNGPK
jgi:hypothetical protein